MPQDNIGGPVPPRESDLKKMQQRLVDEAGEESFPASDPPSWTATGSGGAPDRSDEQERPMRERAARTLRHAGEHVSERARDAYSAGERYFDEAWRRYPAAGRYYRAATEPVQHYPLVAVVAAATMGFGLGLMVASMSRDSSSRRPQSPAYNRRQPPRGWPEATRRSADSY